MGGYDCKACNMRVDMKKEESPWYPYCYNCYKSRKDMNTWVEICTCGVCTGGIEGDKTDKCNIGCCDKAGEVKDDSCSIF